MKTEREANEIILDAKATLEMEGFKVTEKEQQLVKKYLLGDLSVEKLTSMIREELERVRK